MGLGTPWELIGIRFPDGFK